MGLSVECEDPARVEVRLCNRGLAQAPASLHFSVYSGDQLLCAGSAGSALMPGHCVPGPCTLDAPLGPGMPIMATVNDAEPPLLECDVSNNTASDKGCE